MSRSTFLVVHNHSFVSLLHPRFAQISRRFAKIIFLGHVHTSKISWDRLLSFFRLNFSFKLIHLCESALRTLVALQQILEWWFKHDSTIFVATEYSESGICIAMSEGTVITDCCQSSYVCFASFARVATMTV